MLYEKSKRIKRIPIWNQHQWYKILIQFFRLTFSNQQPLINSLLNQCYYLLVQSYTEKISASIGKKVSPIEVFLTKLWYKNHLKRVENAELSTYHKSLITHHRKGVIPLKSI